jgi:hypothetical protein
VRPVLDALALPVVEAPAVQPEPDEAQGDAQQVLGGALALLEQGLALLPTNQPGTATWRQEVLRLLAAQEGDVTVTTASSNGAHPDDDISMALPAPRQAPPDMVEAQRQLVDQALGAGDTNLALALQQLRESTYVGDREPS